MKKIKSFVELDFITVKPYLAGKNLLLFAAVALYMTVLNGSAASSVGIGLMIAFLCTGYPFALGEKNNMDALYATLAIDRRGVVRGRYLFVLVLDICAVLVTFILSSAVLFVLRITDFSLPDGGEVWAFLSMGGGIILMQAAQLPFFFKFGYAKARFLSIIPFALMMAAYSSFSVISKKEEFAVKLNAVWAAISDNRLLMISLALAVIALIALVSYHLSLTFYKKREF